MYKVLFYKTARGKEPAFDFLRKLDQKTRAKFYKLLILLEGFGPQLKRPYADILRDKIYELRLRHGSTQHRVLYFFFEKEHIVLTHGFTKKTTRVPETEIERAKAFREDFKLQILEGVKYEPKKVQEDQ